MKLTKLLFLPMLSIASVPCVSLASCSNAMGVKNVSAELYYSMGKQYADGIEFTLEYVNSVAESGYKEATINGNFVKFRVYSDSTIKCIDKYKHLTFRVSATMIDGTHYASTIELDGYYNYANAIDNYNYLTEIKNVKIVNW